VGDGTVRAPGGSAGNTTFALARMGLACTFLGKLGGDANGRYYREEFAGSGGDCSRFRIDRNAPTAACISLVTPDSERTLRTDLGAAMTFGPDDVELSDFLGCRHAHIEGYLLFNRDLLTVVLETVCEVGCSISLDLGSFEVVEAAGDYLAGMLDSHVDIVFANEEEAAAFSGTSDPGAGLEALAKHCGTVAVKLGKEGALLKNAAGTMHVPAVPVDRVLDTTGAGDFWAAGFLYGFLHGFELGECGRLGAILGGEVVRRFGASLDDAAWERITGSLPAG